MDATAFCSNHAWKRWFWPQKLSMNAPRFESAFWNAVYSKSAFWNAVYSKISMDETAFCSNHVWKRWFWPQKLSINAPSVSFHFLQVLRSVIAKQCIVSLQRLSNLMPVGHFFSLNLNNKVLATFPCDLEDHLRTFDMIYWMFGVIIWLWWDRTCRQWRNYGGGGGGGHRGARAPQSAGIFFLLVIEVCDVRLGKVPNTSHFLG